MRNNNPSEKTGTGARLRRKAVPIGLVASISFLIAAILNASMTSMPPSISAPSPLTEVSAQLVEGQRTNSLLSSSSLSTSTTSSSSSSSSSMPTSTHPDFKFSYSKLGVSTVSYQRILYDSETHSLRLTNISTAVKENDSGKLSLSQGQSQSQSNKQVSDSDQKNLQQMIDKNGFFQTNDIYPPSDTGVNENYDTLYVLSIEMDNKHHTVIWTDNSENIPTVLQSIVKAIEKISSA